MRLKADIARVVAARYEMEFRQEELRVQAERLNAQIKLQLEKEAELENKLKDMGE